MRDLQYFEGLGDEVVARWRKTGHSFSEFSKIAATLLSERPPRDSVDVPGLIDCLIPPQGKDRDTLPAQFAGKTEGFGDPPLTVFNRDGVVIDVYFWSHSFPGIHNHPFRGAFCLLNGKSLHARYNVWDRQQITASYYRSKIELAEVENVRLGEPYEFGLEQESGLTHALVHTTRFAVSMVVRTRFRDDSDFYFELLSPVRRDPAVLQHDSYMEQLGVEQVRSVHLLESLYSSGHPERDRALKNFLASTYLDAALYAYDTLAAGPDEEFGLRMREQIVGEFGERALPILNALDDRREWLAQVTEVDDDVCRFVQAAALYVESREQLAGALLGQYPNRKLEELLAWWARHTFEFEGEPEEGKWKQDALVMLTAERRSREEIIEKLGCRADLEDLNAHLDEALSFQVVRLLAT